MGSSSRAVSDKREGGACWGRGDWAEGRWRGGKSGVCLDGVAQPVRRERGALHWRGHERKRGEWGRRVVRVVCASGTWGQGFRVSGCFSSVKGAVRGRVRSVG